MTIYKCDICGESVNRLNSIILYKKSFDYCDKCKRKAEEIKDNFKKEVDYENTILDSRLKTKEKSIISKMKYKVNKEGTND